jgi:carbon monoxide dehydrogenase subunit G
VRLAFFVFQGLSGVRAVIGVFRAICETQVAHVSLFLYCVILFFGRVPMMARFVKEGVMNKSMVHREVIQLAATPEQVKQFVLTPERILDYFPGAMGGVVLEENQAIICQGKSAVSLIEYMPNESHEGQMTVKVTTATPFKGALTRENVMTNIFFTMTEDWAVEAVGGGTRLTKTWRDIEKMKMKLLPMTLIVRMSAKGESKKLQAAWDKAAE